MIINIFLTFVHYNMRPEVHRAAQIVIVAELECVVLTNSPADKIKIAFANLRYCSPCKTLHINVIKYSGGGFQC